MNLPQERNRIFDAIILLHKVSAETTLFLLKGQLQNTGTGYFLMVSAYYLYEKNSGLVLSSLSYVISKQATGLMCHCF